MGAEYFSATEGLQGKFIHNSCGKMLLCGEMEDRWRGLFWGFTFLIGELRMPLNFALYEETWFDARGPLMWGDAPFNNCHAPCSGDCRCRQTRLEDTSTGRNRCVHQLSRAGKEGGGEAEGAASVPHWPESPQRSYPFQERPGAEARAQQIRTLTLQNSAVGITFRHWLGKARLGKEAFLLHVLLFTAVCIISMLGSCVMSTIPEYELPVKGRTYQSLWESFIAPRCAGFK